MTLPRRIDGHGITSCEVPVSAHSADLSRFEAELKRSASGELVARTTRPDERPLGTIAVDQTLITVCNPMIEDAGTALAAPGDTRQAYAAQVAASGSGALLITDQRLIGIVTRLAAEDAAPLLRADGSGNIIVYSIDRGVLDHIDVERGGLRKKVKEIVLRGPGAVTVQLLRALNPETLIGRDAASGPMRSATRLRITVQKILDGQQSSHAGDAAASLLTAFVR